MQFWLLKTEPDTWNIDQQKIKGIEPWNGVRNYQARNYMKTMKSGDLAFFYHTGLEKKIVGIVEIVKEYYPDVDERFVCVDVKFIKKLESPVTLKQIKLNKSLENMALVNNSRLSVQPVTKSEFELILKISNTNLIFEE